MKWFPCELHTHTVHSDGTFTVETLAKASKASELSCITLTDHNTMSGIADITPELEKETVQIIRGIEWTTYFGHMVVLGAASYVDWRDAVPSNIDDKIRDIHKAGGIAGIAHPFALGSPMCTGCYWQFDVKDWSLVDYIEVWSEGFPAITVANKRALELWTNLLDKGFKIAATSGRDWHGSEDDSLPVGITYLGIPEDNISPELALEALKKGRTSVTIGPLLLIKAECRGNIALPGDAIRSGKARVAVCIDMDTRRSIWDKYNIKLEKAALVTKGGEVLIQKEIARWEDEMIFDIDIPEGWLRAELYGEAMGRKCMIAYTSPVYVY